MALSSIRRTIPVIAKKLDVLARVRLVQVAEEEHQKVLQEQKARNGYEPAWVGFGDRPGTPVEQAQQLVVFKYTYLNEIVQEFLKALRDASPVDSGRYKSSHGLYINDMPADPSTRVEPGMDFFIANPVVYARRLEVGKTESGRDFLVSVPNHIYERTQKKLGAKYANAAKIRMGYVTMPDPWVVQGKLPLHYVNKHGRVTKRRQVVGSPVRSPAIFFEML